MVHNSGLMEVGNGRKNNYLIDFPLTTRIYAVAACGFACGVGQAAMVGDAHVGRIFYINISLPRLYALPLSIISYKYIPLENEDKS